MCGANEPQYQLQLRDNLIAASFVGRWNTAIDLAFMTELGAAMQNMRGRCWGFLVDMRLWDMPDEVVNSMQRAKVDLDRRNQVAECWLVRDGRQGYFIKPLLVELNIPLTLCYSDQEALQWLRSQDMQLPDKFQLSS